MITVAGVVAGLVVLVSGAWTWTRKMNRMQLRARYLELVIAEDVDGLNEADAVELEKLHKEFG